MKVILLEDGVELVPETDYERKCMRTISGKKLSAQFSDQWNGIGNMLLTWEPHEWDKKK